MTPFSIILMLTFSQATTEMNRGLQASMFLGARAADVQRKLPVCHQVVLVSDEATYLDEISKWSPTARWPVLFDREPFASQFIRKFKPTKVWRRESVSDSSIQNLEEKMKQCVARAWGGTASIEIALSDIALPPMGIVFTSAKDPARTAAVALAAGRGQLLSFISNDWGEIKDTLDASKTRALMNDVEQAVAATGSKYEALGDTIDAVTMCMSLPSRVQFSGARENPIALTDIVGRKSDGQRFAWTGWIFGSKVEAAYMAMCSLFLDRSQYWFCNTYPNSDGWSMYGLGNINEILPQYGIEATVIDGTLASLQREDIGGVTTDVAYFTSKGNQDFLDMKDLRTSPNWLPILDTPSALYFIHSWSLKNPAGKTTVGGSWLSRGVYAYVGSSHEPMLNAFVPPVEMLRRTMSLVPFLIAARWNDGEGVMAKPWRVNTIGDPLMLCPPKGAVQRQILEPLEDTDYFDIAEATKQSMESAISEPSDEHFATAISLATLLGLDDMACSLWMAGMEQQKVGVLSARAAMPSLFREEQINSFLWAFRTVLKPTRQEKDMLWHLVGMSKEAPLSLLVENIRPPYGCDDISLIAERFLATNGKNALVSLIEKELQQAKGRNSRELERMRKQYGE